MAGEYDPEPIKCTSCGKVFQPHFGTYGLRCPHCGQGQTR